MKGVSLPRGSYVPISVMRSEFKNISPPEDVILTRTKEGCKGPSGILLEQYKLSASSDKVLAHYKTELESRGGQFLYAKYGYGYVFCKEKIRASLLFRESEKTYDFSVFLILTPLHLAALRINDFLCGELI